jgi:hypothetical protein
MSNFKKQTNRIRGQHVTTLRVYNLSNNDGLILHFDHKKIQVFLKDN